MTIVGVILCFRTLAQEALHDVSALLVSCKFTSSEVLAKVVLVLGGGDVCSVADLKHHVSNGDSLPARLGQEADREAGREAVFLLLHLLVDESPFLTMDLLESCFPYALLRNAAHAVYKAEA
ncbi:hypothetical protein HPB48_011207 [Haemaphysalis longicornis]|uniref:Uncharacterized protein n=1 Tax=Haemaphysalis longicornis TaxID=44386 RepID=A0A9J6FVK0_HAELO|nr:hypothetical protein HPB48_011207 [Haemaphysalis longicornis]